MAIQTINLTVPGGDTPRSANTKINANFSNNTHAASRLVGGETGNLIQIGFNGIGKYWDRRLSNDNNANPETLQNTGLSLTLERDAFSPYGTQISYLALNLMSWSTATKELNARLIFRDTDAYLQSPNGTVWGTAMKIYHSGNTTKEPTTGYLKAASPILHLFNDDLTREHEAVEQNIVVEKLGVGDYLIKGSTGLSDEGWNLSPPKDIHGNVLCFVEATEADGNINIKTYKRKFDFDIVAIVADHDQPFDIPEGHSVDLRLNNLPTQPNNP